MTLNSSFSTALVLQVVRNTGSNYYHTSDTIEWQWVEYLQLHLVQEHGKTQTLNAQLAPQLFGMISSQHV